MPYGDNCSPRRAEPYPPSEISPHIHSAGSVAVLVNVETTPVQLHATLSPSGDPAGRGISSYFGPPIHSLSRIVLGFAVGGATQTVPMYVAELAPPRRRGAQSKSQTTTM